MAHQILLCVNGIGLLPYMKTTRDFTTSKMILSHNAKDILLKLGHLVFVFVIHQLVINTNNHSHTSEPSILTFALKSWNGVHIFTHHAYLQSSIKSGTQHCNVFGQTFLILFCTAFLPSDLQSGLKFFPSRK